MVKKVTKDSVILCIILVLAAGIRLYRIEDLMMFIGDQGWFYISARDMFFGNIPLVGITSSHTWLHQGALWTYLLAGVLFLGNFNPVSGSYLTVILGVITVYGMYYVGKKMFGKTTGLIAATLYAFSPLVIIHSRMSYHTSPIPLLTLALLYVTYLWTQGRPHVFPWIIFLFALLYNFELAIFTLVPIVGLIFLYGLVKKKKWVTGLRKRQVIIKSVILFLLPMLPMILYDIPRGFPQTLKFLVWVAYKIALLFGFPNPHPASENVYTMTTFILELLKRLIFLPSLHITVGIFLASICMLCWHLYKGYIKKRIASSYLLLSLFFFVPVAGYISAKTNSEGYVIIFFPVVFFMIAVLFSEMARLKIGKYISILLLLVMSFMNAQALIQKDYLMTRDGYGLSYAQRLVIAKTIIHEAKGRSFTLSSIGPGSQYISHTMNYEYILWWLGNPPHERATLQFVVNDEESRVQLEQAK